MFGYIRLLIFDLDFLIFDAGLLKQRALRQSLLSFADVIPPHVRLPDALDVEASFLEHGHHWISGLDIGLSDRELEDLEGTYRTQERRLVEAGGGAIFPALEEAVAKFRGAGLLTAIGAEATRDYLMDVSDRHQMNGLFGIAVCTEEFGVSGADEMIDEIVSMAEVHPSEALCFGTRSAFFQSARNQDVLTVGCGWGLHKHESLAEADAQCLSPAEMNDTVLRADRYQARHRT